MRSAIRPALLVALTATAACAQGPTAPTTVAGQFEAFWKTFDREYSYFAYKGINWDSLGAVFRPRAAEAATTADLVLIVKEVLAPLRDVHAWFVTPTGATEPSFVPTAQRNWDREIWLATTRACNHTQVKPNLGYCRIDGIAYVTIGAWDSRQFAVADLDAVVNAAQDATAMIVDVRPNGGGNDALAMAFAGRFATARIVASYVRYRDGARHDEFGRETARYLEPRGTFRFTRPVIVLAGRGVFSSNETFVSAMRELPNVTILGDTTGGSSGNPRLHALGNGWRYAVPRWIEWTADRRVIEWSGIPPDVFVPWDPALVAAGRDPVLEAALARLR